MRVAGQTAMRTAVVTAICVLGSAVPVLAEEPLPPQETPAFDVTFPDDWSISHAQDPNEAGDGTVVLQAGPADDADVCQVIDLGNARAALRELGVGHPTALMHIAADLLDRAGTSRTSGLGYGNAWSSYMEGPLERGDAFNLYSYLGQDAWPGLENAWLVLVCSAPEAPFDRWETIASSVEFGVPDHVAASTGPVVLGGLAEVPSVGVSLEVPAEWLAVDLTDPDFKAAVRAYGSEGEWFGTQLEHSVGDSVRRHLADGETLALWTWAADHGYEWPEQCSLTTGAPDWESAEAIVELAQARDPAAVDPDHADKWSLVELPAGEAARFDYFWSASSGGVSYFLFEDGRQIELRCTDQNFNSATDIRSKRERWHAVAESIVLGAPEEA